MSTSLYIGCLLRSQTLSGHSRKKENDCKALLFQEERLMERYNISSLPFSNLSAAVLADLALPELTSATAYPRTSVALVLNW